MSVTVAVDRAVKTYDGAPAPALDGLSLSIEAGSSTAVIGPNGAGKTTLMKLLTGTLTPNEGDVSVGGLSPNDKHARAAIGYVPQTPALYPTLTAAENLKLFATLQGVPAAERAERVARQLEVAGLEEYADKRVSTFSPGMAQRLHVACAFVHAPRLLLLDEPTAGVDVQSRKRIYRMVQELHQNGTTVLLTTHLLEEVEHLSETVHVVDHGTLVTSGTLREIVTEHAAAGVRLNCDATDEEIADVAGVAIEKLQSKGGWVTVPLETAAEGEALIADLRARGRTIRSYEISEGSLETAFLSLTGEALRDD